MFPHVRVREDLLLRRWQGLRMDWLTWGEEERRFDSHSSSTSVLHHLEEDLPESHELTAT